MTDGVTEPEPTEHRALVVDRVERLLSEHAPDGDRAEFMGAQFDLGLAWVQFPTGSGGLGIAPRYQAIVDERLDAATGYRPRFMDILGHGMGAPMLVAHGTESQKQRWLRKIFTGEEIWCQLFSEPGAGSDVAGLSTKAVRDGDEWIVTGQKVWTTVAHLAKWGMVLTRTDFDLPKHSGLTYFIMDMHAPGVEIEPLRQVTGETEFNEVYMTEVRIPADNMIGEPGEGWSVALTTLMNERVAIGAKPAERNSGPIGDLVAVWRERGGSAADRDRLVQLWVEAEAARLTNTRAREWRNAGTPGPEGSTAKLVYAELNKEIYDFAATLLGNDAMLYPGYDPEVAAEAVDDIRRLFLRSRAYSIEGGTSEIMKNILGERVLGLPGEPRADKDVPWTQVPRS